MSVTRINVEDSNCKPVGRPILSRVMWREWGAIKIVRSIKPASSSLDVDERQRYSGVGAVSSISINSLDKLVGGR